MSNETCPLPHQKTPKFGQSGLAENLSFVLPISTHQAAAAEAAGCRHGQVMTAVFWCAHAQLTLQLHHVPISRSQNDLPRCGSDFPLSVLSRTIFRGISPQPYLAHPEVV